MNAPQALRQPCVNIKGKGAFFQRPEGFQIKRNGMFLEAREVVSG